MSSRVAIPTVAANTAGGAIADVNNQEVAALAAAVIRLCPLHAEMIAGGLAPPTGFSPIEWRIWRLNPLAVAIIFFDFVVTDGSAPIEGVTVHVTDAEGHTDSAVTNASGRASFPNDPSGAFVAGAGSYTATAPGFFDYPLSEQLTTPKDVAISDGLTENFVMAPVGSKVAFNFKVVISPGNTVPIVGAQIQVYQNGVLAFQGVSDAAGLCAVPSSAGVLSGFGSHIIVTATGYDAFDAPGMDVTLASPFTVGLTATP